MPVNACTQTGPPSPARAALSGILADLEVRLATLLPQDADDATERSPQVTFAKLPPRRDREAWQSEDSDPSSLQSGCSGLRPAEPRGAGVARRSRSASAASSKDTSRSAVSALRHRDSWRPDDARADAAGRESRPAGGLFPSPGRPRGLTASATSGSGLGRLELLEIWQDMHIDRALNTSMELARTFTERAMSPAFESTTQAPSAIRAISFNPANSHNAHTSMSQLVEKVTVNPLSVQRLLWEAVGMIFVLYDVIVTPFQEAFSSSMYESHGLVAMEIVILTYWSIDLPSNFVVGFYENGSIVLQNEGTVLQTNAVKMMMHYLRGWFVIDAVLLTCNSILVYFLVSGPRQAQDLAWIQAGRIIRVVKFFKLIRLLKLHSLFGRLKERFYSNQRKTYSKVVALLLWIIMINHFLACCWYKIGDASVGPSWIQTNFVHDHGTWYRYFTSFHWSLTQFTPASMEVVPENTTERAYTCAVVMAAMVVFSSFVGSITEAMTHLRRTNIRRSKQISEMRQYMHDNQVSLDVSTRAMAFVTHERGSFKTRKLGHEVELLKSLPEAMRIEVRQEVIRPTIVRHPFLCRLWEVNAPLMHALCKDVVRERTHSAGEVLVHGGQRAESMYFLNFGTVELATGESVTFLDHKGEVTWMCEAALWATWVHHGTLIARTSAVMFSTPISPTHEKLKAYPDVLPSCQRYAILFVEVANTHWEAVSDIWIASDLLQDLAHECWLEAHSNRSSEVAQRASWGSFFLRRGSLGSDGTGSTKSPQKQSSSKPSPKEGRSSR